MSRSVVYCCTVHSFQNSIASIFFFCMVKNTVVEIYWNYIAWSQVLGMFFEHRLWWWLWQTIWTQQHSWQPQKNRFSFRFFHEAHERCAKPKVQSPMMPMVVTSRSWHGWTGWCSGDETSVFPQNLFGPGQLAWCLQERELLQVRNLSDFLPWPRGVWRQPWRSNVFVISFTKSCFRMILDVPTAVFFFFVLHHNLTRNLNPIPNSCDFAPNPCWPWRHGFGDHQQ